MNPEGENHLIHIAFCMIRGDRLQNSELLFFLRRPKLACLDLRFKCSLTQCVCCSKYDTIKIYIHKNCRSGPVDGAWDCSVGHVASSRVKLSLLLTCWKMCALLHSFYFSVIFVGLKLQAQIPYHL